MGKFDATIDSKIVYRWRDSLGDHEITFPVEGFEWLHGPMMTTAQRWGEIWLRNPDSEEIWCDGTDSATRLHAMKTAPAGPTDTVDSLLATLDGMGWAVGLDHHAHGAYEGRWFGGATLRGFRETDPAGHHQLVGAAASPLEALQDLLECVRKAEEER